MRIKIICCCLFFLFAVNKTFAQKQDKDSLPDYMKRFHYYRLPGIPDSATFFKRFDSAYQRKLLMDSLQRRYDSLMQQRKQISLPARNTFAYNDIKKTKALE